MESPFELEGLFSGWMEELRITDNLVRFTEQAFTSYALLVFGRNKCVLFGDFQVIRVVAELPPSGFHCVWVFVYR